MHLLQYIHWDPDPSIFGLPFRWYGLLFASSFALGYILMRRIFKYERVPEKWLESLTIYMAVSTVIGARLGHCLFYDPGFYLSHPLEILKIWEGGLASHGAAIGIIVGLYIWSRRISHRNVLWILDRVVIMVALSGLTIRTGNLMNSEILGKETTASYGVVFPRADQSENLRLRWEGEVVALEYHPNPSRRIRFFEIYRSPDDRNFQLLAGDPSRVEPTTGESKTVVKLKDLDPGTKGHLRYMTAERIEKSPLIVPNEDTLNPRTAHFEDPFALEKTALVGRWEDDKVHVHLDMRGLVAVNANRESMLLRSNGDGNWVLQHRGALDGNPANLVWDTLDTPENIKNPHYRLVLKEDESLLVARHASQVYEAISYTIIFVLLLWYYYRLKGKVPIGRLFGLFLILIFVMRFLIEFGKEEQASFTVGVPLNVGQLLSIPFVIMGLFFALRSFKNPQLPAELTSESAGK